MLGSHSATSLLQSLFVGDLSYRLYLCWSSKAYISTVLSLHCTENSEDRVKRRNSRFPRCASKSCAIAESFQPAILALQTRESFDVYLRQLSRRLLKASGTWQSRILFPYLYGQIVVCFEFRLRSSLHHKAQFTFIC